MARGKRPVNIPNPEAKPLSADGTALETGWESRTPPDNHSRKGPSIRAGALSACPDPFRRNRGTPRRPAFGTEAARAASFLYRKLGGQRRRTPCVVAPTLSSSQAFRAEVAPGGADLVQGAGCAASRPAPSPRPACSDLCLSRSSRRRVRVVTGGHAHEALPVDRPARRRQAIDLGLKARSLDVVGHGAAVTGDLVGLDPPARRRRPAAPRPRSARTRRPYLPVGWITAPWCVLYGVLSWLKRTSRYGRKTFAVPNSGASSSSIAWSGAFTCSS